MTAVIGFYPGELDRHAWQKSFAVQELECELRLFPDWAPHDDVNFALVWAPPPDLLRKCKNLEAIISLGAGVDHLVEIKDQLPEGVPVIRLADRGLVDFMTEYVLQNVLAHHRNMLGYQALQREEEWREYPATFASDRRVGFLGFGKMAQKAAMFCVALGFDVSAWVRTVREHENVRIFAGMGQLADFLSTTDILVSLLPATAETENLLSEDVLNILPKGAALINAGRGSVLDENALLAALDDGQLAGASLDVFRQEPLPKNHPLWHHPRVILTPHSASPTMPRTAAEYVVSVIQEIRAGRTPKLTVDLNRQY